MKSELNYKLIKKLDRYFLLEVKPKTGRHHQIRVQLSSIGCPIKGDINMVLIEQIDSSIHLHARKIKFIHPVQNREIEIIAPPPLHDNLWKECVN